jgi:hypothetical protein
VADARLAQQHGLNVAGHNLDVATHALDVHQALNPPSHGADAVSKWPDYLPASL